MIRRIIKDKKRKNVAVGGIVELNKSLEPDHTEWASLNIGILYFQKDYQFKSYFFRLFDFSSEESKDDEPLWEAELHNSLEYYQLNNSFHYFSQNDCYVGFNFSSEEYATKFFNTVTKVKRERDELYRNVSKSRKKASASPSLYSRTKPSKSRSSVKESFLDNKLFGGLFGNKNKSKKTEHQLNDTLVHKMKGTLTNMIDMNRIFDASKSNIAVPSDLDLTTNISANSQTSLAADYSGTSLNSSILTPSLFSQIPPPPEPNLDSSSTSSGLPQSPHDYISVTKSLNKRSSSAKSDLHAKSASSNSSQEDVAASVTKTDSLHSTSNTSINNSSRLKIQTGTMIQGSASSMPNISEYSSFSDNKLKPPLLPPRTKPSDKQDRPPVPPKPAKKIKASPAASNQETKGAAIESKQSSQNVPSPPGLPPPPPLPDMLFTPNPAPIVIKTDKKTQNNSAPVQQRSAQEDLLESIKNFKGFKTKPAVSSVQKKPPPPIVKLATGMHDQLKRELDNRQAFLKDSSDESDSDVEW